MKAFKEFIAEKQESEEKDSDHKLLDHKAPPKSLSGFKTEKQTGGSAYIVKGKALHDGSTYKHTKQISPGRTVNVTHATEKHWSELHDNKEPNTVWVGVHDTKKHEYADYGAIQVHHDGKIHSYDNKTGQHWSHKNLNSAINYYTSKITPKKD